MVDSENVKKLHIHCGWWRDYDAIFANVCK